MPPEKGESMLGMDGQTVYRMKELPEIEPAGDNDPPQVVKPADSGEIIGAIAMDPEMASALLAPIKAKVRELMEALEEALIHIWTSIKMLAEHAFEAMTVFADMNGYLDGLLYAANANPRWWHLYKHARKARTRKKYRRLLMLQLRSTLEADETKEVNH